MYICKSADSHVGVESPYVVIKEKSAFFAPYQKVSKNLSYQRAIQIAAYMNNAHNEAIQSIKRLLP